MPSDGDAATTRDACGAGRLRFFFEAPSIRRDAVRAIHCLFLAALLQSPATAGEATEVVVRVLAHDAPLIGDVANGAAVTIRPCTNCASWPATRRRATGATRT